MLLELGNAHPKNARSGGSQVTQVQVAHTNTDDYSIDHGLLREHLFAQAAGASPDEYPVHNFPGSETLTELFNPAGGCWNDHSFDQYPSWVYCEGYPDLAQHIAAYTGCVIGKPSDVPPASAPATMLVVNNGLDVLSDMLGGFSVGFNKATATAASATSLTATATPFVASAYVRCVVVDLTTGVYGIISANTPSVLSVDRWYNPATPGGVAATTPGATDTYVILGGSTPVWFMGISTTNTASVATDTTMAGEITTAGGGCLRTLATFAHTVGTTTFTLANTFTTNASDTASLPYPVARDGLFTSMVVGGTTTMMTETLLNAIATLALTGDAVTITHTLTV